MTEYQFKYEKCVEGFAEPSQAEPWKFLEIENFMKGQGKGYEYLKRLLSAGNSLAFKVWQIDPALKNLSRVVLALLVIGIVYAGYNWWTEPLPATISQQGTNALDSLAQGLRELTLKKVTTAIAFMVGMSVGLYLLIQVLTALVGSFVAENAVRLVRWKDSLRRIAVAAVVSTIGFAAALIHIYIFDTRFLRLSSLKKVKQKSS